MVVGEGQLTALHEERVPATLVAVGDQNTGVVVTVVEPHLHGEAPEGDQSLRAVALECWRACKSNETV